MTYTVKQARKLADLTQVQMADALEVSRDTYRRIEKNPETATIAQGVRIAEVTGLSFDAIFFGVDSTKSRVCAGT